MGQTRCCVSPFRVTCDICPGLARPCPLYPPEPHPCRLPNKRRAIKLANALALQLLLAPHATRLHARPSSLQLRLRVKCTPRSPCDDAQVLPPSSCSGAGHARLCRPLVAALSYCKAALYATTHCSTCQPQPRRCCEHLKPQCGRARTCKVW